jgi:hypothetical protein
VHERFKHLADYPEIFLGLSAIALTTTFLAQLGNHTPIHDQIARIALPLELGTMTTATLAIFTKKRFPEVSRPLSYLALAGLALVSICFLAVPSTDPRYHEFFASRKGFNFKDLPEFARFIKTDFFQRMILGTKELRNLICNALLE